MLSIVHLKNTALSTIQHGSHLVQKHSPEILVGAGIVGVVVSTVMACKATLKVDSINEETQAKYARIVDAKNNRPPEEYSEDDFKKDMTIAYIQGAVGIAKLYAPAAIVGIVSIGAIVGGHTILNRRNAAVMAAYKVLDTSFKKYRERVAVEVGEEKEKELRYGEMHKKVLVEETDGETNEKKLVEASVPNTDTNIASQYARWFSPETTTQWQRDRSFNMFFLKGQENYANQMLQAKGILFLNEVYDSLGLPRTKGGQAVGWVLGGKGNGYVDFGIFSEFNQETYEDPENGKNPPILLDFNVDGVVWDNL